eukprot:19300_1
MPHKWLFADTFGNQYLYEFDVSSLLKTSKKMQESASEAGKMKGRHSQKPRPLTEPQKKLKQIESERLQSEQLKLKENADMIQQLVQEHELHHSASEPRKHSHSLGGTTPITVETRRLISLLKESYNFQSDRSLFHDLRRRLLVDHRRQVSDADISQSPYNSIVEILVP